MRAHAEDRDVVVVFVPLWADNVSGNRSKQYNKHMNVLGMNSNLPGKFLNQEFFQHFISTLQHALSSEQFSAILEIVKYVLRSPSTLYTNFSMQRHQNQPNKNIQCGDSAALLSCTASA
jgi:hypothetical protein